MAKTPADIRSLCRAFTNETVQIIAGIARAEETPPAVRVSAIAMLWDRGWGKAPQARTDEDGENKVRVTIRHITEGSCEQPQVIEAKPLQLAENGKRQP